MKVNTVLCNNVNQHRTLTKNIEFKGKVNNRYFSDSVIWEAKQAFDNPNWRDKFLSRKTSISETLTTWHDRDSAGIGGRIIGALCSFGLTEIGFGILCTIEDQQENREIDKEIEKISECIEEIRKNGGPSHAYIEIDS